jgi:hypothetical protein
MKITTREHSGAQADKMAVRVAFVFFLIARQPATWPSPCMES